MNSTNSETSNIRSEVFDFCMILSFTRVSYVYMKGINRGNPGAKGGKGIETLGSRPLAVLALQIAGCDIIETGITKNVLFSLTGRDVFAAFSYYHSQLSLIVHLLAGRQDRRSAQLDPRSPKAA